MSVGGIHLQPLSRTTWLLLASLAVAGCETAPSSPAPAVSGSFVGQVTGSDAFVSIVTDGTEVRAYLCDGSSQGVSISEWFRGTTIARNAVDLTSQSGNARLVAELRPASVTGTIRLPDGRTLPFETETATGDAGLFAFKDEQIELTAGWVIIIPEIGNGQRGAVRFGDALMHVPLDLNTGDVNTATANIPELGVITPGKVTPINVQRFFTNGWP